MPRNPSATAQIASLRLEISGLRAVNDGLRRRQKHLLGVIDGLRECNKSLVLEIKTIREWCGVPQLEQGLADARRDLAAALKVRDDLHARVALLSVKLANIAALSSEP